MLLMNDFLSWEVDKVSVFKAKLTNKLLYTVNISCEINFQYQFIATL